MAMRSQMNEGSLRDRCREAKVVLQGGKPLHEIAAEFSSDGRWMFVCCGRSVEVYSYGSHQVVCTLRHAGAVSAALLNPKNHMQLITASLDGKLSLWDFMDGALLRVIDFDTPLHKFAIRPGKVEPLIFLVIKKVEMSVVGVSSHVMTERNSATPPSDHLRDAQQLVATNNTPRDFKFTCNGCHLVTCSENGKRLIIYDFETETHYRYKCRHGVTALACHPSRLCVATGNTRGEIKLWYDFAKSGISEIVTTLHWHAHGVGDLCFTSDGTYLLSGGEEGVLVLWQLKKNHKQFRPRLGAAITRVSCSPDDSCFTVSLQNNVIELVSGLNSDVEGVLGGLRKALVTSPKENAVRTGLVLRPYSTSLVLNSTPGFLQFYDTDTASLSNELDVVGLNYVSRTDDKPIIPTTVDHATFSPSGDWMATVESRDDGNTTPELRMKFWKFQAAQQRYEQNTCVDPPHDKTVTSLSFQPATQTTPPLPRHSEITPTSAFSSDSTPTSADSAPSLLAVTTSLDERFKVWVLVDAEGGKDEEGEGEGEGEGAEGGKKRRRRKKKMPSWACRSVSYYHRLPCMGAAFAQDSSLLAVNFSKNITLWDPYLCELRQTFSTPYSNETFKQVLFGQHSSSHHLMASATEHLHVWDLLSCRLLWRVSVSVTYLAADPFSHLAAAFVQSEGEGSLLYLLFPSSPTPLAVHSLPSKKPVTGATFVPHTWDPSKMRKMVTGEQSTLYFMSSDQVLYSLETSSGDSSEEAGGGKKPIPTAHKIKTELEGGAHKSFTEIFGQRKRPNGLYTSSGDKTSSIPPRLPPSMALLHAPPHVLPPPTLLCAQFMKRLLPPIPSSSGPRGSVATEDRDDEVAGVDDDPKVGRDEDPPEDIKRSHTVPSPAGKVDRRKTGSGGGLKASNYEFLVDYFKSNTCP